MKVFLKPDYRAARHCATLILKGEVLFGQAQNVAIACVNHGMGFVEQPRVRVLLSGRNSSRVVRIARTVEQLQQLRPVCSLAGDIAWRDVSGAT